MHLYKLAKNFYARCPSCCNPAHLSRLGSDEKRQDQKRVHQGYSQGRMVRNEDEQGQAEVVWTCHEERPRICRKKDDGNGVTRKEEKRETKEKIFRCSKRRYGEIWCKGDGCWRQDGLENDNTMWPPLIEGKGCKKNKMT